MAANAEGFYLLIFSESPNIIDFHLPQAKIRTKQQQCFGAHLGSCERRNALAFPHHSVLESVEHFDYFCRAFCAPHHSQ